MGKFHERNAISTKIWQRKEMLKMFKDKGWNDVAAYEERKIQKLEEELKNLKIEK